METKYQKPVSERLDEAQKNAGLPHGMGSQVLSDLVKHSLARIDTVMEDAVKLCDEPYDAFKVMAAIAATALNRFGNGPLTEVLPEGLIDLPEGKRRHAIVDVINTLTIESDKLTQRERVIGMILQTCILATYGPNKREDKLMAMVEAILRT